MTIVFASVQHGNLPINFKLAVPVNCVWNSLLIALLIARNCNIDSLDFEVTRDDLIQTHLFTMEL